MILFAVLFLFLCFCFADICFVLLAVKDFTQGRVLLCNGELPCLKNDGHGNLSSADVVFISSFDENVFAKRIINFSDCKIHLSPIPDDDLEFVGLADGKLSFSNVEDVNMDKFPFPISFPLQAQPFVLDQPLLDSHFAFMTSVSSISDVSLNIPDLGGNDVIFLDLDFTLLNAEFDFDNPVLYDSRTPDIINSWKRKGVKVFSITARAFDERSATFRQLGNLNIKFLDDYSYCKGITECCSGVLFVEEKGPKLAEFMEKNFPRAQRLIFVDDLASNLFSVFKSIKGHEMLSNIELHLYHSMAEISFQRYWKKRELNAFELFKQLENHKVNILIDFASQSASEIHDKISLLMKNFNRAPAVLMSYNLLSNSKFSFSCSNSPIQNTLVPLSLLIYHRFQGYFLYDNPSSNSFFQYFSNLFDGKYSTLMLTTDSCHAHLLKKMMKQLNKAVKVFILSEACL